ncbi:hypothetical protein CSUI_007004 [Cystoisospora suis]|uniref:Uncharacterized protein n=1 Tax=Cystoisospora suis TaxID=483139 RepID=A0A2C6KNP7_9APIC|nr:hypothetical protein CSUI_007004 [Cystoisospora suis]
MPRVPVPGPSGLCPGANVFGLQYPDRATKQEGPPGLCSGEFFHAKVSTQGNSASSHSLERRGTPLSSASDPEPFCLSWKPSNTSFPYTAGPRALASPAWGIGAVGVPGDRSQLVVSVVSLDGRVLAAYADGSALLLHRNIRCCSVFTPSRANSPCRDASSGHILSAFPPLHSRGALPAKDRSGQPASRGRGLVVSRFLCSYVTDPVLRTRIGHAVSLRNRFLPRVVRAEDQCTAHSGGCRRRSGPLFCLSTSAMDNQNCLCNGSIQEPSFSVAVSPEPLLCSPPVAGQFPGSLSHASSAQRKVFSLSKYTDVHWPCLSVSCRDRVLSLLHISLQCVLRAAGLYLSRSPQEHLSSKLRQVGASEFFRNGPVGGEPSTVAAASEPALQAAGVIRLLRHARRQLQAVQGLFKRLSGFVCIRETGDVLVNAMVTGGTAICRSRGSRNGALWSVGAHRPYNETWSGRDAAKKDGAVVFHRDSSAPPCSEICGAGRVRRGWDLSQQYSLEVCLVLHPSARFVSTKWPACTSSRRTVVPLRACTPDYHAMLRDELLVGNSSISPPSSRRPPAGCLPMTPIFHQSSVPGVACDGLLPWDDVECSTSPSTSFHSGGRPITNAEITLAYAYEVQEQVFPVTTAAAEQLWAWPLKIAFMGHALHQLQEMLRELSTALTPFEKDESRRHSQEVGIAAEASKSCDTGESASSVVCAPPGAASARTTVQRSPKDAALFPTTPGLPGACGNSLEAIGQALKRVYRRGVHVRRILDDLGRLFLSSDATTFSTSRPSPDRQGTLDFQGARHPGVTAVIKSNAAGRSCVSAESSTEVIGENFGCRASLAVDPPDLLLVSLPLPSVQSAPRSASDLGGWSEEPPMPMDAFLRLADQIKLGGHHDKAASDCHLARDTCAWQVGQHGCGMEICGSSFGGCSAYSCIGGAFCLSKRRGDCRTQREDLRPVLSSTVPSLLSETSVPLASGLCRPRGPPSVRPNSMIDAGCPVLSSLVCVVPSIGTIFLCPTSIAWGCVSCACFCVSAGRQIPEQNIHTHSATDSEAFQLQGCVHDGRACCSDSMNISNSCLWVPFRPCALSDFSQFTSESPSGNDKRSDLGRDLFSDSTDAVGPVPSQHRPFSEAHSRHCPERLPPTGGAPAKSDVCWSLLASPASPRRRTVALQWLPPDRQQGALYTLLSAAEFLAYTQLIRFRHSGIVATLLLEGACALTPGALAAAVNEGKAASAIAEAIPEVVAALQEVDGLQRGETNRVPLGEVSDGDSQWNRNRSGFAKGHGSNLEEVVARGGEEALRVIFEILSVDRKGLTSSGTARSEATAEFTKTEDLNRGCASYFGRRSSSQSTVRMQAALGVEASGRGGPSHCAVKRKNHRVVHSMDKLGGAGAEHLRAKDMKRGRLLQNFQTRWLSNRPLLRQRV